MTARQTQTDDANDDSYTAYLSTPDYDYIDEVLHTFIDIDDHLYVEVLILYNYGPTSNSTSRYNARVERVTHEPVTIPDGARGSTSVRRQGASSFGDADLDEFLTSLKLRLPVREASDAVYDRIRQFEP